MSRGVADVRSFFGPRAAGWDERFPDDGPAYARAVADLGVAPGAVALDLGCGTARAFAPLRAAVGDDGLVLGLDATPEMLAAAAAAGRTALGHLVLGDAAVLPFRTSSVDAVLAAGLLGNLPSAAGGLAGLARVVRPGGRLGLFHPISRAALAARHGRVPTDDDVTAEPTLVPLLRATGWRLVSLDDGDDRYLAVAERVRS